MDKVVLTVQELPQEHIGMGHALVDPKVLKEKGWKAGQVLELSHNRKTYVRLPPSSIRQVGKRMIRQSITKVRDHSRLFASGGSDAAMIGIDGTTRRNIGAGIGDRITVMSAGAADASQITISPTREIELGGLEEYMRDTYRGQVFTVGDTITLDIQGNERVRFVVTSTSPVRKPVIVTGKTAFKQGGMTKEVDTTVSLVSYDELGGFKDEIPKVREMVELPLRHPELFETIGVEAPKGVLLYGPPGTGKTMLARAVAGESNAHFITVNGGEIMGKAYGESEKRIRTVFTEAEKSAPSIIFMDEIDAIAPKRDDVHGEVEKRVVSQILTLMDGMKSRGKIVVIAATNRPNSLDPALRRPGRFDREIEIGVPDEEARHEILMIHTRMMPLGARVDLEKISKATHGFVGADIRALSKEAGMSSLRRIMPAIAADQEQIPASILRKIVVTEEDFGHALKEVKPSALREVLVQIPNVGFDDVGGLEDLKEELRRAVEWPLRYKDAYSYADVKAPKGVLLHGPPGTGKTLIAKALARQAGVNFISVKGPELIAKWVGDSEKGVRETFRKARQASPCILFLDEVDSMIPKRGADSSAGGRVIERVVAQMLTEIDGLEELHGVLVMGATNRIDIMDEAMLRPGRFDKIIEVPNPDCEAREKILEIHTKRKPLAGDVKMPKLARLTDGFNGAEVEAVTNTAAVTAIQRYIDGGKGDVEEIEITQADLVAAIKSIKPGKRRQ